LALKGCEEFGRVLQDVDFDYLCMSVGTGATMAGIITGLNPNRNVIGFSVLKGGDFLKNDIEHFLEKNSSKVYGNWKLDASYHLGGYAKVPKELQGFRLEMVSRHNLPLDPVYTGKLLWAVTDYVRNDKFKPGSTVLALHTGGLQGSSTLPTPNTV